MSRLQQLEALKDMVQQAVDRGATSVEDIHQTIAALPIDALEKAGLMKDDRLQLRERQRRAIALVYDTIRGINRQVGALISDQFENLEDGAEVVSRLEPPRKPRRRRG